MWMEREGQKLLGTKSPMAQKWSWTGSESHFEVLQICHWRGFLASSVICSSKHCFPTLICKHHHKGCVKGKQEEDYPSSRNDLMCFITIGHQENTASAQSAFKMYHESLLTGDQSDIDQCLICFAVVAMLFSASLNTFFSFYFFKSDRIITGIESWVTNLFPDLNPFPLVLVGKLTRIVLVSLLKRYLMSCFTSTNTYVCLWKRTQWIFIIVYLFTDEAGCKGVPWFGIILWLHQRNYGSGIYMVECQGLDITLLRLPYSYNSKTLSECIFILYVVAGA